MSIGPVVREAFLAGGCEGEGERGERGERGKRGKRGHRGHRGHDGHDGHDGRDGATGPTGPTGLAGSAGLAGATGATGASGDDTLAAGRFQPDAGPPGTVTIVSQTGQFATATYISTGFYEVVMSPIPGLTSILQTIPVATALSIGSNVTVSPFATAGTFRVAITDLAGNPIDDTFFLQVKLLLP